MNEHAGIGWIGASGARIVDLSAPLNAQTAVFPGDPPYRLDWHTRIRDSGWNLSRLETGLHVGAHVDAPLHAFDSGADIASMPLERFVGEALAIATPKQPGEDITPADLAGADVRPGDIVLFYTGWETRSGTPRFFEGAWPGVSVELVDTLIGLGAKAIGGDFASLDSPAALERGAPAHRRALSAGLPVFEALVNLREVAGRRFLFVGLPLRLEGAEGSPERAIAILPE